MTNQAYIITKGGLNVRIIRSVRIVIAIRILYIQKQSFGLVMCMGTCTTTPVNFDLHV